MPNINWSEFTPMAPLHWTTIIHYLLLLGAVGILLTSGDKVNNFYILIIAAFAISVGIDLYVDRISLYRIAVFVVRVAMVGIPLSIAGIAPTDANRNLGGLCAFLALIILALTFFNCFLPWPIPDPRIIAWCG